MFTLSDSVQADATIKEIEAVDGVASVRADEDVIRKLIQIQRVFNMIAAAMIVGLAVISIFIISNTRKAAPCSPASEEISIQKMVGATNWFIRWPFVIEGMVLGLVAGGLAFLRRVGSVHRAVQRGRYGVAALRSHLFVRCAALAGCSACYCRSQARCSASAAR